MERQLAKVICDSVSPHGVRLTTMEVQLPRIVLAELNTHRAFARNSASSRAIPVEKLLASTRSNPYVPERWGVNGKGMQDYGEATPLKALLARSAWLGASRAAIVFARILLALGIHKQTTNRLLEPFLWHTVIISATEWSNFLNLRCHPDAHPAIRNTAEAMRCALANSEPRALGFGAWHLPYVDERDDVLSLQERIKLSVARCARVSYLTHDGVRDPAHDLALYDKLRSSGHMSPFEHAARPMTGWDVVAMLRDKDGVSVDYDLVNPSQHFAGNFRGWMQERKHIAGESDMLAGAR